MENGEKISAFLNKSNVFWTVVFLLLTLIIFSHHASDLAVLDGGIDHPVENLFGPFGARISRFLFYWFGLAVYPAWAILLVMTVRRFLPFPMKRKGFFPCFLLALAGLSMFFALYPDKPGFLNLTDSLGIGRISLDTATSALSGGVFGMLLASPGNPVCDISPGWIRALFGEPATLVVALLLYLPALIFMLVKDWMFLLTMDWRLKNTLSGNDNSAGTQPAAASVPAPVPAAVPDNTETIPPAVTDMTAPETPAPNTAANVNPAPAGTPETVPGTVPAGVSSGETGKQGSLLGRILDKFKGQIPIPQNSNESVPFSVNSVEPEPDSAAYDYVVLPPRVIGTFDSPATVAAPNVANPAPVQNAGQPVSMPSAAGTPVPENISQPQPPPVQSVPAPVQPRGVMPAYPDYSDDEVEEDETNTPVSAPVPAVQTQQTPRNRSLPVETPVGIQPAIRQYANTQEQARSSGGITSMNCSDYELPSVKMLDYHDDAKTEDQSYLEQGRTRIQQTLDSFNIAGHVEAIVVGPRVTRYEVLLDEGVEVSKITRIQGNIAMKMCAESIRILAPIPGKDAVGIEVPNKNSSIVYIRSVMESPEWTQSKRAIPIVLGRNVEGNAIVTDLSRAPHLLIAGSTGSGKSVCMNTLIMSLLYRFSPNDLNLILVDPKIVEMEAYSTIPHLITPVVNDLKKAPLALRWGVNEMERRYRRMAKVHAKDLKTFNARPRDPEIVIDDEGKVIPQHMPYLIIIIDELADIMMTEGKKDVETSICRIAQKGRAAGVHLVIATQTPRKDIITGVIKANLPVKIAFKVASNMDSRVILDQGGAEKLLGMGDLLFNPPGAASLERIQMTLVTDDEIHRTVDFVSNQMPQQFDEQVVADESEDADNETPSGRKDNSRSNVQDEPEDDEYVASNELVDSVAAKYLQPGDSPLLRKALELIINERQASISLFQRRLGIGYNKSAELVDQLERRNIVSKPLGGGQKREILILDGLEVAQQE